MDKEHVYREEIINIMDVRTWMAGQALSGLCANPGISNTLAAKFNEQKDLAGKVYASMAREIADATLAELAKEKPL